MQNNHSLILYQKYKHLLKEEIDNLVQNQIYDINITLKALRFEQLSIKFKLQAGWYDQNNFDLIET